MGHVFFSYSHKNAAMADKVTSTLLARGFAVWQDVISIRGGDNWQDAIQAGLQDAAAVVVLWSEASAQSDWVKREIQLARVKGKPIIPLRLDDTPLTDDVALSQAIPLHINWKQGLDRLIRELPQDIRRRALDFKLDQPLGTQAGARQVAAGPLVSIPLMTSSYCQAHVVGLPATIVGSPNYVQLCLQFRRKGDAFISEIHKYVESLPEEGRPPFIALHVTGPFDEVENQHYLDDLNTAQWFDAVYTTLEAVEALSQGGYPTLQLFILGPSVLAFALGRKMYRFWPVQLFNYAAGNYVRVMDVPPE